MMHLHLTGLYVHVNSACVQTPMGSPTTPSPSQAHAKLICQCQDTNSSVTVPHTEAHGDRTTVALHGDVGDVPVPVWQRGSQQGCPILCWLCQPWQTGRGCAHPGLRCPTDALVCCPVQTHHQQHLCQANLSHGADIPLQLCHLRDIHQHHS